MEEIKNSFIHATLCCTLKTYVVPALHFQVCLSPSKSVDVKPITYKKVCLPSFDIFLFIWTAVCNIGGIKNGRKSIFKNNK